MSVVGAPQARLTAWLDEALELWWRVGADHVAGGFHEAMDQAGRPVKAPRRAKVQARQIYVYATAGAIGWTGPWRKAVDHGLAYLDAAYRREDGLVRGALTPEGRPADDGTMLYDQAFALFALAAARRVLPERDDLVDRGRSLLAAVERTYAHGVGFRESSPTRPFQANPVMHLLEAALAWRALDRSAVWDALADRLAELGLARLIDAGGEFVREFFDTDWRPSPGPDGDVVEPGHLYEWAWLLARWGRLRGREDAAEASLRLFAWGEAHGVDRTRGVVIGEVDPHGRPVNQVARLWPQTERLKAATLLNRPAEAADAAEALLGYLETPVRGLWRDKLKPDGRFVEEPAPASSFYHLTCAIAETLGATEAPGAEGP